MEWLLVWGIGGTLDFKGDGGGGEHVSVVNPMLGGRLIPLLINQFDPPPPKQPQCVARKTLQNF